MSTARFGKKWADVDEDEEEVEAQDPKSRGARFETPVDENGIKTVIEYTERDGRTYKVSKKVKQTVVQNWTNKHITERKTMKKFGKALTASAAEEKMVVERCVEEVNIELSKKLSANTAVKDDAEDKFYEDSLTLAENLTKVKASWTDMNKEKQAGLEPVEEEKKDDKAATVGGAGDNVGGKEVAGSKYVPPSLRGAAAGGKGDGKGGKGDMQAQQEASLRITNLSDDCRDGDLQDLFGQFGRLQRVYLAKDMVTYQSRGFAFITYYSRADAQKAIDKLHGHGYDNLILQVQFAKPKA